MWSSLLVIGSFILLGAAALYLRAREVKAYRSRRAKALKATARIIGVDDSENSKQTGDILANLTLEVTPPSGPAYTLHGVQFYIEPGAAPMVKEGLVMKIRIDQEDDTIIYPAERWAHAA